MPRKASISSAPGRRQRRKGGYSRRLFLEASLAGLAAVAGSQVGEGDRRGSATAKAAEREPSQAAFPKITSDEDIDRLLPQLNNWGRWGDDDQLGTLNFITPETRLRAVGLIKTGRIVSLAREISPAKTEGLRQAKYELHRYLDPPPEESGCIDFIGMIYHGFAVTHIDALCHLFTPEGKQGMYNGFPISDVTPEGAKSLGVERMGEQGIVGRGVLLDIAAVKGAPLPLGTAITIGDLEAAERSEGVVVGEGDILFMRNGAGAANTYKHGTGLHPECLMWLRERRVAVVSSDSDSDPHPPLPGFKRWTEPVHMIAIPYLGLPILDNTNLDDIASICREVGRFEFFVTVAPWRFRGATSSPVNPLAIF